MNACTVVIMASPCVWWQGKLLLAARYHFSTKWISCLLWGTFRTIRVQLILLVQHGFLLISWFSRWKVFRDSWQSLLINEYCTLFEHSIYIEPILEYVNGQTVKYMLRILMKQKQVINRLETRWIRQDIPTNDAQYGTIYDTLEMWQAGHELRYLVEGEIGLSRI